MDRAPRPSRTSQRSSPSPHSRDSFGEVAHHKKLIHDGNPNTDSQSVGWHCRFRKSSNCRIVWKWGNPGTLSDIQIIEFPTRLMSLEYLPSERR